MNILKHPLIFSMILAIAFAQETKVGNIEFVSPVLQRIDTQNGNDFYLQIPQMIAGYKPDVISLFSILQCGPRINPEWFSFPICIRWGCKPKSELRIITGGQPAEFGYYHRLDSPINRIPSWRYEWALTDTQGMTLHRTRSYRYRNSIL